ncbi:probable GPI-anchored adhesin-like protein PGA55 [Stegastes partitus]|nr:PREDICTED: proline-rich protein 14 [Stegastes partitus]
MVQVSLSEQPRVERAHVHEKQNEDGVDFSFTAERQNKEKDQKTPDVSPGESEVEQLAQNTTKNVDDTKSDMSTCRELAAEDTFENTPAPKGWVIGPLFQSFKSKMASFTEIVMSPVKLFRTNSPPPSMPHPDKLSECELQVAETTDAEHSEPSNTFHSGQSEDRNQGTTTVSQRLSDVGGAHDTETFLPKYSKKLDFDAELSTRSSEQTAECAINQKTKISPDLVPFTHSPLPCIVSEQVSETVGSAIKSSILLRSTADVSASNIPKLNLSSAVEDQKNKVASRLKIPPKRRTGNRSEFKKVNSRTLMSEDIKEESDSEVSDRQLSHQYSVKSNNGDSDKILSLSSSIYYAQPDSDGLQPNDSDGDAGNMESCSLVQQSLYHNISDGATKRTLEPTVDTLQLECQLIPETCSGTGSERAKRAMKPNCNSQDSSISKRLKANPEDTKNEALLNITSDTGRRRELRPPRKEAVLINTNRDGEETLKPSRTRQATSTKTNRKGKGRQEMLATINEAALHMQTESSPDAMLVCSLDKSSGVSEDIQKGCSSKVKPSSTCKRLKTSTVLSKADVNFDNGMDVETTVAITSTKQAEEEPLPEVLVRPDIKQLQGKCRNMNKKPLKRKSPDQASPMTEPDSTSMSDTLVVSLEPLELTLRNLNTSVVQKEENSARGQSQPSKRPKKGLRGAVQSSSGTQETKQCITNSRLLTKESQTKESKGKVSTDPVYFEMTPFEDIPKPVPSSSKPLLDSYGQLYNEDKNFTDGQANCGADEIFLTDCEVSSNSSISLSRLRSSTRRVNIKARRDNQRRKCRVLHSRTRKVEEMTKSVTMEDADLATLSVHSLGNGFSMRLLRSYSCPEIPSLCHHDMPLTSSVHSPHHSRTPTSHHHQSSHNSFVSHAHKSLRRARRHTVCSVEVEREIAPLCLRKEVYPSRRSAPYDPLTQHLSPSLALSPSTSLSALASCFLSSPLAFLSKKVDGRGAAASSPSTSSHVSSPSSSSSLAFPLSSSLWHLPGFNARTDSSGGTLDSNGSGNRLECEIERRHQSEEEEDDGEDTSSSSQEFEDVGLREEKALSDSEIKVVKKHEERGKVSSIRIRKTLPKPQTNLTPMGLPKPIRLKKKEFSLEEIYTNKNFSKPPESRLETIFEVPLNRRNGSESWFGQRRVKRFLEFLEVGEARKPKKPLLGIGKAGITSSRTRRGGFPKDEPSLSAQDMDSLLCAKLDQLNLWLIHDQKDS